MKTIAIIGTGLAGLISAQSLMKSGFKVALFEKSRGPGGRLSSKQSVVGSIDLGAQYFTVRSKALREELSSWKQKGIVKRWNFTPYVFDQNGGTSLSQDSIDRYVGTPKMSIIPRTLSIPIKICYETTIKQARFLEKWTLMDEKANEYGPFDGLILNTPPIQCLPFIPKDSPLVQEASKAILAPCWAVALSFQQPLSTEISAAFVNRGPLRWIANNSSKPDRKLKEETWVLHASSLWSQENRNQTKEVVLQKLQESFFELLMVKKTIITQQIAHFWRYSIPNEGLKKDYLLDQKPKIGICGDWCAEGKVEGAFLSGKRLAEQWKTVY